MGSLFFHPIFWLYLSWAPGIFSEEYTDCHAAAEDHCQSYYEIYNDCLSYVYHHCINTGKPSEVCIAESTSHCQEQQDYINYQKCFSDFEEACKAEESSNWEEKLSKCRVSATEYCQEKHPSSFDEYA